MGFGPAGVHPVEHLAPVLGLGAAGARMEADQGVVIVVMAGEQGLQPAALHVLLQLGEALFQLLQHGIVVLLGGHFTNGHQVVPGRTHLFVMLNFRLGLPGLDHDLLALFGVIPEAGGFLHGVEPFQLIFQSFQIQGICQPIQRRLHFVEPLLIGIKFDIHGCNTHFLFIA